MSLDHFAGQEACIAEIMSSAAAAEDWDVFEFCVVIAARFPDRSMTPVLCEVLGRRPEEVSTEDIVDALGEIGDPAAVGVLEDTLLWQPDWDEFHGLGVKCVWALGRIGTAEALEILRGAAAVGPFKVREAAEHELRRIIGD